MKTPYRRIPFALYGLICLVVLLLATCEPAPDSDVAEAPVTETDATSAEPAFVDSVSCGQGTCVCPSTNACRLTCSGFCEANCGTSSTCEVNCASGQCRMACPAGSNCILNCPAGGCIASCPAGSACALACPGGSCPCNGAGCP